MSILKKALAVMLSAVIVGGTAAAIIPMGEIGGITVNASSAFAFDKKTLSLGLGESYTLKPNERVAKWSSENSDYVSVKDGKVTAKKIGKVRVGAVAATGGSAECTVTVKKAPQKVSLTKSTLTLGLGESFKLSAVIPSDSAAAVRTFRTSNSKIIKMTKTNWEGEFKAVGTGVAWVTVRLYNGKEASCKITVKNAPSSVKLSKSELTMAVGDKASLSASIADNAGAATRTYSSSNSSIVKMTKTNWTGEFTAVKKGTTWVKVRLYNGKEASCKVNVIDKNDMMISKYTEYKLVDAKYTTDGRNVKNTKVSLPLFRYMGSDGDILNKRIKNLCKETVYSYNGDLSYNFKSSIYYYKDILSIVIIANPADYHYPIDYAFNINVKTKKIVSNDEMLKLVGSSLDKYKKNADKFLSSAFYAKHGSNEQTGKVGKSMQDVYDNYASYIATDPDRVKDYIQRAYNLTVNTAGNRNGASAMYIDNNGKLYVDLLIGSMAGADAYYGFAKYN